MTEMIGHHDCQHSNNRVQFLVAGGVGSHDGPDNVGGQNKALRYNAVGWLGPELGGPSFYV